MVSINAVASYSIWEQFFADPFISYYPSEKSMDSKKEKNQSISACMKKVYHARSKGMAYLLNVLLLTASMTLLFMAIFIKKEEIEIPLNRHF